MLSVTSVVSNSLWPMEEPARVLCPWDSPGKNTRVGCCAFLQGIFLTQELNPHLQHLLHCRQALYPLSHEKDFLGKDRLEGGSRRMQLSASAERKKKTERVVRVKGCLLITAFNSFFQNLWGKVVRFPNT